MKTIPPLARVCERRVWNPLLNGRREWRHKPLLLKSVHATARTNPHLERKDVPPELRELPAGQYVVEAVEDEAPTLTPEEEAGIEAALESYRQGRVVDSKRTREIIDAALGR